MRQSWKQDAPTTLGGEIRRFSGRCTRSCYGSTLGGDVTTMETPRIRNKEAKGSSTLMEQKELDVLGWYGNGLAALS